MAANNTSQSGKTIWLDVVTPTKLELRQQVEYIVAPTVQGMTGVLPGHIPLLSQLATGVLRYKADGVERAMAVSDGFMEVTPTKVIVLAEAADLPEHIDVEQALAEKRQAEEDLRHPAENRLDMVKAHTNLQRAMLKLQVAKKYGELKEKE